MALVSQGFRAVLTLGDKYGNTTDVSYKLTSANYTAAVADTAAIVTALLNMSDAVLLGDQITQVFVEDTVVLPTVTATIADKMVATTLIAGSGTKKGNWVVPMPGDSIMSSNSLILTNAAVIAYQALYQTGGKATLSDGETAGTLLRGKRTTRRRAFSE